MKQQYCDDCDIWTDDIMEHYGDWDHLNKTNWAVLNHLVPDEKTGEIWFSYIPVKRKESMK